MCMHILQNRNKAFNQPIHEYNILNLSIFLLLLEIGILNNIRAWLLLKIRKKWYT